MRARGTLVWIWVCALIACGGKEEPPPPEEQPIPLTGLCEAIAQADCERLSTCGRLRAPLDMAGCVAQQRELMCRPDQAAIEAAVQAGALAYFELAARSCRAEVAALDCEVGFQHDLLALPGCRGMVEPLAQEGEGCAISLACGEGLYCDPGSACPGTCKTLGQNNAPCGFDQPCDAPFFCSVTGMRCRARIDLNGVCELALSGNACLDGGFCDASQPGNATCVPVRGRNQGCNSPFECIPGHQCISNRCSAGLSGDACNSAADCENELVCSGGNCVEPGALDETCMQGAKPCALGLTCTSTQGMNACQPSPVTGQICENDCFLGRCVDGRCQAATADGEVCGGSAECLPGRVCDGRCAVLPRSCGG